MTSTDRATRPAALRLTEDDRAKLLRYGATVRAAVLRLIEVAEEHEACPAPAKPQPARVLLARRPPAPPAVSYVVDIPGGQLVTTNHAEAVDTARVHGTRVRRQR